MKRKHKTPITAPAQTGTKKKSKHADGSNESSSSGGGAHDFASMLGGEQVVTALLSSWEENEPCYVEKMLTKFPISRWGIGVSDLLGLIEPQKLTLGRDLIITTGDADLEFGTHYGWAKRAKAEEYFSNGWSLSWFNADRYNAQIRDLLQKFDRFWQGEGGVDSMIQTIPADAVPFPPAVHSCDLLLIQTEGSQHVTLFDVDDEGLAAGSLCTDMGLQFCTTLPHILDPEYDIEPVFSAIMKPGDFLFIPQHLAVFTHTQDMPKSSGAVWLYVPKQMSWNDVMTAAMAAAQEQMGIQTGMKFFPRRAEGEGGMAVLTKSVDDSRNVMSEMLHDMLNVTGESLGAAQKHLARARGGLTREDFAPGTALDGIDLESLIDANGGLVRLRNVLPTDLAERLYQTVDAISPEEWTLTEDATGTTQYAVSVPHAFMSTRRFPNSHAALDVFRKLMPHKAAAFSAGLYATDSHFIDSHDDRAFKDVAGQVHSRDIAFIYYLTKDWTEEDGGALMDNETNTTLVPEFNSAVAFKVPRFHTVMPPTSEKPRYSIFGWFLTPGKLYDMDYTEAGGDAAPTQSKSAEKGKANNDKSARPQSAQPGSKNQRGSSKNNGSAPASKKNPKKANAPKGFAVEPLS